MEDTRQIIPFEEQNAATDRDTQVATLKAFISHLSLEEMSACPDGMELLHLFSLKYPTAYELARQKRFVDVPPTGHRTLGWQAYHCEHVAGYADCQEGGAQPITYQGRR
jgi:hypothetical protein